MSEAEIFEILRQSIWAATAMALPVLAAALVVGFVVGLLQALTSIQEMTLTFIPKMIAVIFAFLASIGYMTRICVDLFNRILYMI